MKNENPFKTMSSTIERREEGFVIFMTYQGANYSFRVNPDSGILSDRYRVFRTGELILDILRIGATWVDTSTRESNGFIREVGKAIDNQVKRERAEITTS